MSTSTVDLTPAAAVEDLASPTVDLASPTVDKASPTVGLASPTVDLASSAACEQSKASSSSESDARAVAKSHCTLPTDLREEMIFEYDLAVYPFPRLIAEALGLPELDGEASSTAVLSELHSTDAGCTWLTGVLRNGSRAYAMRRNVFDCQLKTVNPFRGGGELERTYKRFVEEVVAPLVLADACPRTGETCAQGSQPCAGDASRAGSASAADDDSRADGSPRGSGGGRTLLYQRDPNFRCHLPGTGHLLVHKHCDSDYFHQPNEVNIWVPLSDGVAGSNTLWAESAPGRADFRPFELGPGQAVRFWGHSCEHYTVPNTTAATRVSIDFRVIPTAEGYYRHEYPNARRKDGMLRFAEGAYFAKLPLGAVRAATDNGRRVAR